MLEIRPDLGFVQLDVPSNREDKPIFLMVPLIHASISVTNFMANDNQYATQIAILHGRAAESRQRALESQLALAFTLCEIAKTEIRYHQPDEAIKVLNKVRVHAETMRLHVDEPNHVPSTAISDLRRQLTQLEKRINEIESCLGSR